MNGRQTGHFETGSGRRRTGNGGQDVSVPDSMPKRLLAAVGEIDERLIADAAAFRRIDRSAYAARRRNLQVFATALAAAALVGIVVLAGGGIVGLLHNRPEYQATSAGGVMSEMTEVTEEAAEAEVSAEAAPAEDSAETPMSEAVYGAAAGEKETADTDDAGGANAQAAEKSEQTHWPAEQAAGISEDGAQTESAAEQRADASPSLAKPPALMLLGDGTETAIAANSATWATRAADGDAALTTYAFDAPDPSDAAAVFPTIFCTDGVIAVRSPDVAAFALTFAVAPDELTVSAWDTAKVADGKLSPVAKNMARDEIAVDGLPEGSTWLLKKGLRYEITASWGEESLDLYGGFGEARYVIEVR